MEDHKSAEKAFWGDSMVCVVLNLSSTEEDSDNLGNKGGGKRYYGTITPIWINGELAVRAEKIKLCPANAVNGRGEDSKGGGFIGRRIWMEEDLKGGGFEGDII